MNKATNPGRFTRPDTAQQPSEGRKNPVAEFLAKTSRFSSKMLPVVLSSLAAMACIILLAYVRYISDEFTVILFLANIMLTAFRAGMAWQWLYGK